MQQPTSERQGTTRQLDLRPPRRSWRMVATLGTTLLAAAMAAGCAATTASLSNPGIAMPEGWQGTSAVAGVTTVAHPEDLSTWWLRLGDETLSGLITRALDANLDLQSARSRLRQARAQRSLAGKDYLPDVSGSVSASTSSASGEGATGSDRNLYSAGFDASWEPDVFGSTRNAVRAAQAELEATQASLEDTRVSLVAEVALDYVNLRAAQARRQIAEDNLRQQSETLDLTSWRAQAGLVSDVDVQQARANVEQTRAQLPLLETSIAESEHSLAILVGEAPAALHDMLAQPGPIPAVPASVVVGIPADTVRQRPDVRAAERRVAAEAARLGQAKAALFPSLRLSGSLGIQGLTLGGLTSAETVTRSFLAGLTAPLFDRGRLHRQIDIQSETQQQALLSYKSAVLGALQEVENALVSLGNDERRRGSLAEAADAARSAAQLARDQYTAGLTSYQTVLDTERTVLSVEDNLTSSQAQCTSDLIRLYKAVGGGWTPTPTDAGRPQSEES